MWDLVILDPMINVLIWCYGLLGKNYFLAILITTILSRIIVFPLTWQQQKSALQMQELQPQLEKLREKYKNDPQTLAQKQTELMGMRPLGGCLPMLIQFPILIGFWQAITRSLASSPLQLIDLSQHLYKNVPAWLPDVWALIPLKSKFLWMNLGTPDPYFVLPILVVLTSIIQQRLLTPPTTTSGNEQQAAMQKSMQITMPLMFGVIAISLPSGLSIYYAASNVIGIAQYMAMGKASLKNLFGTEDGSFSWRGLLGLPQPKADSSDRRAARRKSEGKKRQ